MGIDYMSFDFLLRSHNDSTGMSVITEYGVTVVLDLISYQCFIWHISLRHTQFLNLLSKSFQSNSNASTGTSVSQSVSNPLITCEMSTATTCSICLARDLSRAQLDRTIGIYHNKAKLTVMIRMSQPILT